MNRMKHFESQFKAFINAQIIPCPQLKKAIEYVLFPGGKRFRPKLVFATGHVLMLDEKTLIPIAIAIECIHTYALVHDDLPAMDNDELRRHRLTCHKAFDEATAILVGNALHNLALLALTTLKSPTPIMQILLHATGPSGMLSGQSLDLKELSSPHTLSIQQLKNIHYLKTSLLIQVTLDMVMALVPQQSLTEKKALQRFGKYLGLTFQMRDDYLDTYHPISIGKAKSSDQANQKQTFSFFYSEHQLLQCIHTNLKKAEQALFPFGARAHRLIKLINTLYLPQ